MFLAYRLQIYIVLSISIFATTGIANAQQPGKLPPRQKSVPQKKVATDSIFRSKIDSRLLQALAQSSKLKVPEVLEQVEVGADSNGNLPVDISATITDSLLHTITALGGKIIYPSKEYRTVRAIINLSVIKTLALRQDISFIQPAVQAETNKVAPHPLRN